MKSESAKHGIWITYRSKYSLCNNLFYEAWFFHLHIETSKLENAPSKCFLFSISLVGKRTFFFIIFTFGEAKKLNWEPTFNTIRADIQQCRERENNMEVWVFCYWPQKRPRDKVKIYMKVRASFLLCHRRRTNKSIRKNL